MNDIINERRRESEGGEEEEGGGQEEENREVERPEPNNLTPLLGDRNGGGR